MRVSPNEADWQAARSVFRRFARSKGSAHIASDFSLAHIAAVVRERKIRSALEFGAGIGTVTYMLLRCLPEDRVLVSTEHDAFCLEQLQQNIPSEMREGFTLTDSIEIGDRRQNFGLVVSDGKIGKSANCDYLVKGAVCFVEGNRARVRESILRRLTTRGLSCDFEYHSQPSRRFDWRRTASGIPYPRVNWSLSPTRGCWIGEVH